MALRNRARMTISSFAGGVGSGNLNLGSNTAGYQSFDSAGVADQEVVTYCIEEGTLWELGTGTYTASGTILARTDGNVIAGSSGAGTKVATFTTAATVFLTASAADFVSTSSANTFTANQTFPNTGLRIKDTGTNVLTISTTEDYTADRTLTFVLGDSNRTLTLSGNATISGTNTGDQNVYSTIAVSGQTSLTAGSTSDTLNVATTGAGLSITTTVGTDTITFALDEELQDIAGLSPTDDGVIIGNGTAFVVESGSTLRTSLGLGSLATLSTVNNGNWSGTALSISNGGTGATSATNAFNALAPTTTDGDTIYYNGTNNVRLAGSTSATKKYLTQTGNGTVSAAPAWGDITNVGTVTDGTWQGTAVAVSYGGTGTNSFTSGSLLKGAGTSAITTATAGTDFVKPGTLTVGTIKAAASLTTDASLNIPPGTAPSSPNSGDVWNASGVLYYRNNAAATETIASYTGSALSATKGGTGFSTYATGDLLYSDATNSLAKLAGNTTTTRKFLSQVGNGSASAAPTWETTIPMANGGTGASLTDPNDDRIMFWDDNPGSVAWLAPNGYNVKIDTTTLYVEETWMVAASDETTALTTGNGKATFVFPYSVTVVSVGCYIHTASSSGNVTVDINKAGTSILSSVLTMSSPSTKSATTSTFVSPPVSYSANEEVRIDIDSAGTGAKGLKVWMIVRRTS